MPRRTVPVREHPAQRGPRAGHVRPRTPSSLLQPSSSPPVGVVRRCFSKPPHAYHGPALQKNRPGMKTTSPGNKRPLSEYNDKGKEIFAAHPERLSRTASSAAVG